jgi:hypothetical protein
VARRKAPSALFRKTAEALRRQFRHAYVSAQGATTVAAPALLQADVVWQIANSVEDPKMSVIEVGLSAAEKDQRSQPHEQTGGRSAIFRSVVSISQVIADFLSSTCGVFIAYHIYYSLDIGKHISYQSYQVLILAVVVGILTAVLFERDGAYRGTNSLLKVRETGRAIRIPGQSLFLILPVTYLLGRSFSRWVLDKRSLIN